MAGATKEYNYVINADWRFNGNVLPLDPTAVKSLIIDRDFDKTNMPIIFLELAITKSLLDKITINKNKATMRLSIQKFESGTDFRYDYLNEEFCYFLTNDVNHNISLDYSGDHASTDSLFVSCVVGLMSLSLINKNKSACNGVYKNATTADVLVHSLRSMNLVMEQPISKSWGELLIPNVNSLTELVSYMNYRSVLYTTPYRFFMDFNRTYLLSCKSKAFGVKGEKINTVIIEVLDPLSHDSKGQGTMIDYEASVYKIPVDANEHSIKEDNVTDKSYTEITGISASGKTKTVAINSGENISHSKKTKFVRISGDNLGLVDNMKYQIETNATTFTITKSNIDNSIITLDKIYHIRNFKTSAYLDGTYLLTRKREIYTKTQSHFNCETVLNFRKAVQ